MTIFRVILENELGRRKISVRQAAQEIGISHTTLIAAMRGTRNLDMPTALAISRWLGVPLSAVVEEADPAAHQEGEIVQVLKMAAEASPELNRVFADIAKALADGRLDAEDFRDIADYAAYTTGEYAAYKIRVRLEQGKHGA